jgi:hypothetical protein
MEYAMKLMATLFSCVLIAAAAGCKDESKPPQNSSGHPTTAPMIHAPTTMPAHHAVLPPVHVAAATPLVRPQEAAPVLTQELLLLRRHRWSRTPTALEMAAAAKVFEGRSAGAPGDARKAVDFIGLTPAKVKAMVGNPCAKQVVDSDQIWTYSYSARGQTVTYSMKFHNGAVVPDQNLIVAGM